LCVGVFPPALRSSWAPHMLLHQPLIIAARATPDKIAIIAGADQVSFGELDRLSEQLGSALQARNIRRGDRVVIFLDNRIEAVVAIYAVLKVGAVFILVNPLTKQAKLDYLVRNSGATAVITQSSMSAVVRAVAGHCPAVHSIVDVDGPGVISDESASLATAYPGPPDGVVTSPGTIDADLASIIYTSGSTGDAKGVVLTHVNMVSAAGSVLAYLQLVPSDVIFCALPLAFDYGLYQVLMAVQVGACVVLERSFAFPADAVETMRREQVTVLPGVPTLFTMIMRLRTISADHGLRIRLLTNTAAALSERQIRELRRRFPGALLFSMYGLTECHRVTYLPPEELDRRPTSVGRGMPNEEVWLVSESGERLPNGSTGELVIRGSHVFQGYWNDPGATAERLRPAGLLGERLLFSGDLFRTDADGFLYFLARKDDIIKSRGEKISPREVENVIHSLDGVLEVAVRGIQDDILGEAVKAWVVADAGVTLTERDVIRHCLANIENFMAPKYVEFVAELPRTDTGKVRKQSLQ